MEPCYTCHTGTCIVREVADYITFTSMEEDYQARYRHFADKVTRTIKSESALLGRPLSVA